MKSSLKEFDAACNEGLPTPAMLFRAGSLYSMRQFYDYHPERPIFNLATEYFEVFEDLPDGVSLPLRGNDHA